MEFRIIEKDAFTVTGKIREVATQDESNLREIPAFWQECAQDENGHEAGRVEKGGEMFGICMDFAEEGRFNDMIGVEAAACADENAGLVSRYDP
ncbi:effector binding domain-containing protein [Paenibacillus sp. JTLBN-2024]